MSTDTLPITNGGTGTTLSHVYNGIEVKLTGRVATKQITTTSRRTREISTSDETLHEITPKNAEEGSWKKWVKLDELYTINGK